MEVRKQSAALGAEIRGIDITGPLSAEVVATLEAAFLAHGVLLFRNQPLTPIELVAFSRHFGALQPHVQRAYQHPEAAEVVIMSNRKSDGSFDEVGARRGAIENLRDGWHSDLSYDPNPAKATLLHALEVPAHGGNTCFSNVALAYDDLPQAVKDSLAGVAAEFRLGNNLRNPKAEIASQNLDSAGKAARAVHPAINTHPETRRPAIYVNPLLTTRLLGLDPEAAERVLETLFDAIDRVEYRWEHEWSVGDTLMWDNRGGVMHCGRLDYPRAQARRFIRTTVTGGPIEAHRRPARSP